MASIVKLGKGKQPPRAIDFVGLDGKRKRIRLGIVTLEQARQAKLRVEKLVAAKKLNQTPDSETVTWLRGVSDKLHDRIARVDLCPPREPTSACPTLAGFLKKYIEQRCHELEPSSVERLENTRDRLQPYFGCELPLDQITPNMTKDWRASIIEEGLTEGTARTHCRNAKTIFNDAVERELISRNPFAKLKSAATARGDAYYVTPSEAVQVLEACPNLEWRVLFALCRYGGLRCPSETHAVTWRDVDWENRRLHVYGKKTGKHREMPVVPKLYRILSEAFEMAADGAEQIVTLSTNNLHRTLEKILERAGVERWGDLFQALRASCETQLSETCPGHAIASWLGHSRKVSRKHYLMVSDEIFAMATSEKNAAESAAVGPRTTSQMPRCEKTNAPHCQ